MAAKPVPSAKVIELTVTVLFDPTFLLSKVQPTVCTNISEPTHPVKVTVVVSFVNPSYIFSAFDVVAVNVFSQISAFVDD